MYGFRAYSDRRQLPAAFSLSSTHSVSTFSSAATRCLSWCSSWYSSILSAIVYESLSPVGTDLTAAAVAPGGASTTPKPQGNDLALLGRAGGAEPPGRFH